MELDPRTQLEEQLESLDLNIQAYRHGRTAGWLAVPNRLYILLCRGKRAAPLAPKVIPDFSLHPLLHDMSPEREEYLLKLPTVLFDNQGFELQLFDLEQRRIPLSKWLSQTVAILPGAESPVYITVEQVIRYARHQAGGAHVDPRPGETIRAASSWVFRERRQARPFLVKCLIAIGEYVLSEIRAQLPVA